jgi:hypothetical protein
MSSLVTQKKEVEALQILIDSKQLPSHVKTVEMAYVITQFGKELGVKAMQSLHEIVPINGKLGMSARLQAGLALQYGIRYTLIRDLEYVYVEPNGSVLYSRFPIPDKKHWDRETTFLFERKDSEGNWQKQEVSFTYKDALKAELLDKDNWKKWLSNMCISRCITKGLNIVAPDVMRGLLTLDEMHDIGWLKEENVNRDEDGNIQNVVDA